MTSLLLSLLLLAGPTLPSLDLTRPGAAREWQATHDISALTATADGMVIAISGGDPYTVGPALELPADLPLWLTLRLRSDAGGNGQVFWAQPGFAEEHSAHFLAKAGQWVEVKVPIPAIGPSTRLRFDPPGTSGTCTVARIGFLPRVLKSAPTWPQPTVPVLPADAPSLTAGQLTLRHHASQLGAFALRYGQELLACGQNQPRIGYTLGDRGRWFEPSAGRTTARAERGRLVVTTQATDPDDAQWTLTTTFSAGPRPDSLAVEARVVVDRDRQVDYLPLFTLFPGLGNWGTARNQALLAGVEYLDMPDLSSSEADLTGTQAQRQVTDTARLTMPLMACQALGHWVSLSWQPMPNLCAVFDSPDRLFSSGAGVMGLLYPGSDGLNRPEGSLLPYDSLLLPANRPVTLRAWITAGRGASVVPAVQAYVAQNPLPPVPRVDAARYVKEAAHGWLDTPIRTDDQYRHAWWPGVSGFGPQPAADAAVYEAWLAQRCGDPALAQRLTDAAQAALAKVPPAQRAQAGVSHVRYPLAPLVFGGIDEMVTTARDQGRALLGRFQPDGSIPYVASPDRPDYGRTHYAKDANGLTAQVVTLVLESAMISGDAQLRTDALRVLRALDKFDNTVPRGAQTWECALHTPDILASAHLVKAYTMGYELTGDATLLDRARYWAWTGVPFTYLAPPTDQPVGLYATTPVLGATQWVSPNWIGLPVQWCGLVYSDALYRLARIDRDSPWRQLADGITASGIQQSWPAGDDSLVGLLPDSFNLKGQSRNPVAINPGTVQANAVQLFDRAPLYSSWVDRTNGLIVHAPGGLTLARAFPGMLELDLRAWKRPGGQVLVTGKTTDWLARVDGKTVPPSTGRAWLVLPAGRRIQLYHSSLAAQGLLPLDNAGSIR
ncbi:MAG: hypothetical protein HZB16_24590 [Armatimonadetes bacterium]|nr:hypothetical protein [Armatimonadota bacterium]